MASQADGNTCLPFIDLMKLERINDFTFRSVAQPFSPGASHPNASGRTYGGHVLAQAAWAAAQTVPKSFLLHNITGWFILAGLVTVPFIYEVSTIRDGRSYCTRTVSVTQDIDKGICFTCTCSFQKTEASILDVQESVNTWGKYKSVLNDNTPESFPTTPTVDLPWYWKWLEEGSKSDDKFPGLVTRKVDMRPYNGPRQPLDRRQLIFYRSMSVLSDDDPNIHLCAHAYASDLNSLYIVANHVGVGDTFSQMGSLAHTVIFHAPFKDMKFCPPKGDGNRQGNWFCKEDYTTRASVGRALYNSRVQAPDGTHIATIIQDGMLRVSRWPSEPRNVRL